MDWINKITIQHKGRVYIVPTIIGLSYSLVILALLLLASTYNNIYLFLFTTSLVTLGIMSLFITNSNLQNIDCKVPNELVVQEGSSSGFNIKLRSKVKFDQYALKISLYSDNETIITDDFTDIYQGKETIYTINFKSNLPEQISIHMIRLETCFPLGLFRSWTYFPCDLKIYVYPMPEGNSNAFLSQTNHQHSTIGKTHSPSLGPNDFRSLRPYQRGDRFQQIDWKGVAKGKGMMVKEWEGESHDSRCIKIPSGDHTNLLTRLRLTSKTIHQFEAAKIPYHLVISEDNTVTYGFEPSLKELSLYAKRKD